MTADVRRVKGSPDIPVPSSETEKDKERNITMNSSSAASDHPDTADNLHRRRVAQKIIPWNNPRPIQDVWNDMLSIFQPIPGQTLPSPLNILRPVLTRKYQTEEEFDEALFMAMQKCLSCSCLSIEDGNQKNDDCIFLHATEKYAVGLARNVVVRCTPYLVAENASSTISSCGLTSAGCRPHHGSWIFEKINDQWTATDVFSVVEINESAKSCGTFETNKAGAVINANVRNRHAPLGQAVLYTMGSVLLHHVRNGVLTSDTRGEESETSLPFAILAGDTSVGVPRKVRWVFGDVLIPEACCDKFYYRVKCFGKFDNRPDEDMNSIDQALSAYLDTLLFGLRVATSVFLDRVGDVQRGPNPMSGMALMIGRQPLDWPVLANPISKQTKNDACNRYMKVSQAELFAGKLNVHETFVASNLRKPRYMVFDSSNMKVPVLVKVSSKAVHDMLIFPEFAFAAIAFAQSALVLGSPLLGVIQMDAGLITIMADLSKEGYEILKPKQRYSNKLVSLWKGFKELAINVLLPMAEFDVIHADIRPGYDFTANILFKENVDGTVHMQLIDYESLVVLSSWAAPPNNRGYLSGNRAGNGATFVFWQCVSVAYAWLEERNVCTRNVDPELADVRGLEELDELPAWFPDSCRAFARQAINEDSSVTETLTHLDKVFAARDDLMSKGMRKGKILNTLAEMASDL